MTVLHGNFFWEAQEPGEGDRDGPGEGFSQYCIFLSQLNREGANSPCATAQVQSCICTI